MAHRSTQSKLECQETFWKVDITKSFLLDTAQEAIYNEILKICSGRGGNFTNPGRVPVSQYVQYCVMTWLHPNIPALRCQTPVPILSTMLAAFIARRDGGKLSKTVPEDTELWLRVEMHVSHQAQMQVIVGARRHEYHEISRESWHSQ